MRLSGLVGVCCLVLAGLSFAQSAGSFWLSCDIKSGSNYGGYFPKLLLIEGKSVTLYQYNDGGSLDRWADFCEEHIGVCEINQDKISWRSSDVAGVEWSIDRRTSSASYSYDEEGDHGEVHRSSGICRVIPDPRPPAAF